MRDTTIFVQIASYRDEELLKTIESCLKNALHPHLLRFGIVNQFDQGTEHDLDMYATDDRFRIEKMPWQEARGAGWARHLCNNLYKDESFTLQIDSHMRFDPGWDEELIEVWMTLNDSSAVLSSHPHQYWYDENGKEQRKRSSGGFLPVLKGFFNHTVPYVQPRKMPIIHPNAGPRKSYFVAAGSIFAPGAVCKNVGYEKDVAFMGEEVVYSAKLFTSGYTIYSMPSSPLYHLYQRKGSAPLWTENSNADDIAQAERYKEITAASGKLSQEIVQGRRPDILGSVRTMKQFERYVGVDFRHYIVHPNLYQGEIPPIVKEKTDSWVDQVYPATKRQTHVRLSENVANADMKRIFVRMYDEWNVLVWSGNAQTHTDDSLILSYESRTKPSVVYVYARNSDDTPWEILDSSIVKTDTLT